MADLFGPADVRRRLLSTLAVIVVLWAARRMVLALAFRRIDQPGARYHWQKTANYVSATLGVLVVGRIWFEGFASLATFLGLLSAGIAIALKDLLVNLAGWAFILWRRPFQVGDRVQLGGQAGDVIDLRLFQFSLLEIGNWVDADQTTGRVIHVPNGKVFTEPLANYTHGFEYLWNEVPVMVTFESDWEEAKRILREIGARHATHLTAAAETQFRAVTRQFLIVAPALTPEVYTAVADSGVVLTLRYVTLARQRRQTAEVIWEAILRAFAERDDIDFAYPTRRFYDNLIEGKSGARAAPPPS